MDKSILACFALATSTVAVAQDRIIPEDRTRAPFQFADDAKVEEGSVSVGSTLVSGPMHYGYPAVALADFSVSNQWGRYELKAGDEFYGVPMGYSGMRPWMVYCSPRLRGERAWATCLIAGEGVPVTMSSTTDNPFTVQHIAMARGRSSDGRISFAQGQNSLAENLRAAVRVTKIANGNIELSTFVSKDSVLVGQTRQRVKLRNGRVVLTFGQGAVELRQTGLALALLPVRPIMAGDRIFSESEKP